jgi:DNA-binding transcriptional regulator of glucitol operon
MILHPLSVKAINAIAMPVLGFAVACMICAIAYFAFGWWQNRRYDREEREQNWRP